MAKRVPLNLSVPPALKAWIEQRVAGGEFESPDACVVEAIRHAKMVHSNAELEKAALRGVRSGPATPMTNRDWRRIESELHRRVAARQSRHKSA